MNFKPLPVGIDNFEKLIEEDYYYIDKTLFIRDLIDKKSEVNLFTRPRRFGKTLTMSMLQHYFEIGKDSTPLFKGLKIMDTGEKYTSLMNQYPLINITLKTVGKLNFPSSFSALKDIIINEFRRHRYLLESSILEKDLKKSFQDIIYETAPDAKYISSLKFLSDCLARHFGKKVIILIDEYDVPLENAFFKGFYDEMIDAMCSLLGDSLKTNPSLYFAVLTGCLRISKESIFTGLNNMDIISILSEHYGEYFGFTESELKQAFSYYKLETRLIDAKEWYNGYWFGSVNIYNPWSIICFLKDAAANKDISPIPYWSNTSSNQIIRTFIEKAGVAEREEIERLIRGESITKPIHEDITYDEIDSSMEDLWSFLFFTGYLKKEKDQSKDRKRFLTMNIPNQEILYIYERKISEWVDEKLKITDPVRLLKAIVHKDTESIIQELNNRLIDMISFYDTAENFYHGFLLGVLSNIGGYKVKSNRETGLGRSDIFMKTTGITKKAMIFECKVLAEKDDAEEKCKEALRQIQEKKYDSELKQEGYQDIINYGIVFRGKECLIMTDS
ncbi:MAG: ATP-binding protein [Lachnoclostridium sp.]|nr:ATP-binding protein [Lachnoclostridium sp.]